MTKKKEIKQAASRYTKFVEWSDEDGCFVGRCPEMMLGGVHGMDEAKVYMELCEAVEEMIEIVSRDGAPLPEAFINRAFSGRFVVRIDPALHRRLAAKAEAAGESLNTYCAKKLAKV